MASLLTLFPGGIKAADLQPLAVVHEPHEQLRQAMIDAGMTPPVKPIELDGQFHRFSVNGKRTDDAGWYFGFDLGNGVAAGAFGNWRTGMSCTWKADPGRTLSPIEQMQRTKRLDELRKLREADIAAARAKAADTAQSIWDEARPAPADHPYLARKGIQPHGLRMADDGRLVAPMYADGEIVSVQFIPAEEGGKKLFLAGSKTKGAWWAIGTLAGAKRVYLAEGVATAATVHETTGEPVAVCYSAGNMPAAAQAVREIVGLGVELVMVADHDKHGAGEREAKKAAELVGGRVVMPPIEGMDANDYARAGHDLAALLAPPADDWLIPADDFAAKPAPIRWLIKHWLQADALMMVHGPSGGGKTFAVLDWCLHLASGMTQWAGQTVHPGSVVYLAGEGHHGLRGRVAAWKHRHQPRERLSMWLSRHGCDLNTPEGFLKVVQAIRAADITPSLIVVDTLHRFLQGDENSSQDAKTMLDACNNLMEQFGCSVLLVHHTGVSEEAQHRARGSSAWRGALDIEISIVPAKDNKPMQLVQRKSKDAELAEPVYAVLQSVEIPGWIDEDGQQVTSAVLELADAPAPDEAKTEAEHQKDIRKFSNAWVKAGADVREGSPYLSRSALIEYLMAVEGVSEATAKTYAQESKRGRMVYNLLNAEIIQAHEHGWIVKNNVVAAAMMLRKDKK